MCIRDRSEAALALEVRINDDSGSVMDSVKLIASDMDGTLLNGKGDVYKRQVIKSSRPLILDLAPSDLNPIVQVVDNMERNHKWGLIFEMGIGKGKLLVCMADPEALRKTPEGRQLYSSLAVSYTHLKVISLPKVRCRLRRDAFMRKMQ